MGSHSQTRPSGTSSHDIHVPHGVGPPAQLKVVPPRMRDAPAIWPPGPKRIAEAPPSPCSCTSEFVTRIHPPSGVAKVACPSARVGKT